MSHVPYHLAIPQNMRLLRWIRTTRGFSKHTLFTRTPWRALIVSKWAMTGSNRRPPECKPGALPAELIALNACITARQATGTEIRPRAHALFRLSSTACGFLRASLPGMDRDGFEPPMGAFAANGFTARSLQPFGHLSDVPLKILKWHICAFKGT